MKALTIQQPWAMLIALGAKKIETRSWKTNYRGPLAIHAGKINAKISKDMKNMIDDIFYYDYPIRYQVPEYFSDGAYQCDNLPKGEIIATADLTDCKKIAGYVDGIMGNIVVNTHKVEFEDGEKMYLPADFSLLGDFTEGRYAWILENVQMIDPIKVKGKQGLWNWEVEK